MTPRSLHKKSALSSSHSRLGIVQIGFFIGLLIVLLRLFYWQVLAHGELSQVAASQYTAASSLSAKRGSIYDRSGSLLATNEERYTLFAEPKIVQNSASEIADQLTPLIVQSEIPPEKATDSAFVEDTTRVLRNRLETTLKEGKEKKWLALAQQLSREQKEKIQQLSLKGLGFDTHLFRTYPDASLSAHLLGFVGKDVRGEDQGYFGVEGFYDLELQGREGFIERQKNATGLTLAMSGEQRLSARAGRDLVLTIDKSLQYQVEEALKSGLERYGAKAGEVIVMNPHTGEIYALASFPNYDPNSFVEFDTSWYRNPSVSDLYEPGSTFKVLTVAAALQEKVITPETTCPRCEGPRIISNFPIRTWNGVYNPNVNMKDALAKSDNTAMVFIQEELGKDRFLDWLRKFGLADKTGIDVQGEELTVFRPNEDWRTIDVATASFGQGIAVSSINLVRAVASIANGGKLVRPHVVKAVIQDEEQIPIEPEIQAQVLDPEVTKTVTEMMVYSASQGDAKWTILKDYPVAGKTGTAQIAENGQYLEDKTLTSFIGFAPADNPQFIMLVKLREPTSSPWGSETAAPLWYSIARSLQQNPLQSSQ